MKIRTYVIAVGGLLVLAGVLIGFLMPITIAGAMSPISCGSAFVNDLTDRKQASLDAALLGVGRGRNYGAECIADQDTRKLVVFSLIGLGLVVAAGGAFVRSAATTTARSEPTQNTDR